MQKKGFTLVEIVVVLAVISILVSILVPAATRTITNARRSNTAAQMNAIKTAYATFFADTSMRPATAPLTDGSVPGVFLVQNTLGVANWNGPYLDKVPNNPIFAGTTVQERQGQLFFSAGARFDLDGNGVNDTGGVYYRLTVPAVDQQRIDALLDTTTIGTWNVSGSVRQQGGTLEYLILPN